MIEHLENDHGIAPDFARSTAKRCHISRNNQYRYWCGFCGKVVDLHNTTGVEAWDERFNHIDEHYKSGCAVDNWVDDQMHRRKGDMPRNPHKQKRRGQQETPDYSAAIQGPSSSPYIPQPSNSLKRRRSLSIESPGPAAQRPRHSPEVSHGVRTVWNCVSCRSNRQKPSDD
jgi:hypothetical protein